jgi:hypothetical protein
MTTVTKRGKMMMEHRMGIITDSGETGKEKEK